MGQHEQRAHTPIITAPTVTRAGAGHIPPDASTRPILAPPRQARCMAPKSMSQTRACRFFSAIIIALCWTIWPGRSGTMGILRGQ
jgi:hypothetical protein